MESPNTETNRLLTTLTSVKNTQLDHISSTQTTEIVRDVLRLNANNAPVDIARFGSAV